MRAVRDAGDNFGFEIFCAGLTITDALLGRGGAELPRTQGSAISIIEYLVKLAAHSLRNTRRCLGPRDKPEEIIRGDETDAIINDEISIPSIRDLLNDDKSSRHVVPGPIFPRVATARGLRASSKRCPASTALLHSGLFALVKARKRDYKGASIGSHASSPHSNAPAKPHDPRVAPWAGLGNREASRRRQRLRESSRSVRCQRPAGDVCASSLGE